MTSIVSTKPCIVIPMYYLPELYLIIDKCLKSIKKHYPDWRLIVLDDCSPTYSPFHADIYNGVNKGFTASVNTLLEEGFKYSDVVIVCNDDIEIRKGDLDKFVNLPDGIYSPPDTASGDLDSFGCIWGINKTTYKKLGQLDERFRNYFSDQDYYQRAKKLGIPIVKWTSPLIQHHESSTFNLVDKDTQYFEDLKTFQNS